MPPHFETPGSGRWAAGRRLQLLFRRSRALAVLPLAGVSLIASSLRAQTSAAPTPDPAAHIAEAPGDYWSNRGRWNFGAQLGFALENDIPHNVSHIALLVFQPQAGFIVRDFRRSPVRRFEIVSEGILGNAVHPGGRLTGYALLFRLDGRKHGRFVPFFDAGGGMQHTTLDSRALELSGHFQFSPQGGLGLQWFFNPQRALVFEYRYMHMSNAGLRSPNRGFNASMLTLGFRWLRRPALAPGQADSGHPHKILHYLFGK